MNVFQSKVHLYRSMILYPVVDPCAVSFSFFEFNSEAALMPQLPPA